MTVKFAALAILCPVLICGCGKGGHPSPKTKSPPAAQSEVPMLNRKIETLDSKNQAAKTNRAQLQKQLDDLNTQLQANQAKSAKLEQKVERLQNTP